MRTRIPLVAILLLLVTAPSASACSCVQFDPAWVEEHDAAIVGEVVQVRDAFFMLPTTKRTLVRVERSRDDEFQRGEVVQVHSGQGGGDCGLELAVGDRAGLLLQRSGDSWMGSLCATTTAERLATELDRIDPRNGAIPTLASYVTALMAWIQAGPTAMDWDPCLPAPIRRA